MDYETKLLFQELKYLDAFIIWQKHLASIPNALHQYRHDADCALLCKAVLATAFVPRNRIDEALSTLGRQLPSHLYFLIDWFEDNYVGKYK